MENSQKIVLSTLFFAIMLALTPAALATEELYIDFNVLSAGVINDSYEAGGNNDTREYIGGFWYTPTGDVKTDHNFDTNPSTVGTPLETVPATGHFAAIWQFEVTGSSGNDWDAVVASGDYIFTMKWENGELMWTTASGEGSNSTVIPEITFSHAGEFSETFGKWTENNFNENTPGAALDDVWTYFNIENVTDGSLTGKTGTFAVVATDLAEEDVMGFKELTENNANISGLDPEDGEGQWATFLGTPQTTGKLSASPPYFDILPETNAVINQGEAIVVNTSHADDLRIMLWAKELEGISAAQAAYYDDERVFSARLSTLIAGGINATADDGLFTIVIDETFIDLLLDGTRFEGGVPSTDNYEWFVGNATSWIITPEMDGGLWSQYNTWDGANVDETFRVFNVTRTPANITVTSWDVPEVAVIGENVTATTNFTNTGQATFNGTVGYFFGGNDTGMSDENLVIEGGETVSVERTYPVTGPTGFFNHSIRYLNEAEEWEILEQRQVAVYGENTTEFNVCEYGIGVQTYIDEVPAGSTVFLCDGTYNGQIVIDRDISLVGESIGGVTLFGGTGSSLNIKDVAGVSVQNLSVHAGIYGSGDVSSSLAGPNSAYGFELSNVSSTNVTNVEIRGARDTGIYVEEATNLLFDNVVTSWTREGPGMLLVNTNNTIVNGLTAQYNMWNAWGTADQRDFSVIIAGSSHNITADALDSEDDVEITTMGTQFSNLNLNGFEYRTLTINSENFGVQTTNPPSENLDEVAFYFRGLEESRDFARFLTDYGMSESPLAWDSYVEELVTGKYFAIDEHFGALIDAYMGEGLNENLLFGDEELSVFLPQGWYELMGVDDCTQDCLLEYTNYHTIIATSNASSSGLPEHRAERGTVEFGSPDAELEFNSDVTIDIFVGADHNGKELIVYRSNVSDGGWTQDGLSTTTCVVADGWCGFNTTKASYYTATEDTTPEPTTTTTSSGGGGGGGLSGYCADGYVRGENGGCVREEPEEEPQEERSEGRSSDESNEESSEESTQEGSDNLQGQGDQQNRTQENTREEEPQEDDNFLTGAVTGGGLGGLGGLGLFALLLGVIAGGYFWFRK